jgi:hypothetical protein
VAALLGSAGATGYDGDLRDYYLLPTGEGEIATLGLTYSAVSGNLRLSLINPDQSTAYTDSSGNPGTRGFSWGCREGNSYVLVESVNGVSDYSLSVSKADPGYDELENNDSSQTAQALTSLPVEDFLGSIALFGYDGDNADFYSFTASEKDLFTFSLDYDFFANNVYLELLNGVGSRIYISDQGNPGSRTYNWSFKAGSYFLKISSNNSPGDYSLGVSKVAGEYDELEENDTLGDAKPLASEVLVDFDGHVGQFGYNGDTNDYQFFNLVASADVQYTLTYDSGQGNVHFFLLNQAGMPISQDTAGNPGTRTVSGNAASGTSYLRVFANSGNSNYTIDGGPL